MLTGNVFAHIFACDLFLFPKERWCLSSLHLSATHPIIIWSQKPLQAFPSAPLGELHHSQLLGELYRTRAVLALFSPAAAHDLPLPSPVFRFAFLVAAHLFGANYRRQKESNRELNLLGISSSSSLPYVQGHSTNV